MKKVKLLALTNSMRDFGLGVFVVECCCHKDGQTSKKNPQEEFHPWAAGSHVEQPAAKVKAQD